MNEPNGGDAHQDFADVVLPQSIDACPGHVVVWLDNRPVSHGGIHISGSKASMLNGMRLGAIISVGPPAPDAAPIPTQAFDPALDIAVKQSGIGPARHESDRRALRLHQIVLIPEVNESVIEFGDDYEIRQVPVSVVTPLADAVRIPASVVAAVRNTRARIEQYRAGNFDQPKEISANGA